MGKSVPEERRKYSAFPEQMKAINQVVVPKTKAGTM